MSIANIKELLSKRIASEELINTDQGNSDRMNINKGSVDDVGPDARCRNLTENDAGIIEYIRDGPAISAVIKQRFSDFHVNEIDEDGNIVYLTSTNIPENPLSEPVEATILDEQILNDLRCLISGEKNLVEIDVTTSDKNQRRNIHKAIKQMYGTSVVSNTVDMPESKKITIKKSVGNKKLDDCRWPDGLGKFLHFIVHKGNLDTIDAVNILASKLRCKASSILYAGTKDKRAKTSQWMCMKYLEPKRLLSINDSLKNIKTGNYVFKSAELKLGSLKGNLFKIALRNIIAPDDVIIQALDSLKTKGFINYFGLQRFGNHADVPTYEIGKALCKSDFRSAVNLILKPRLGENPDLLSARKLWWETKDAGKAYSLLLSKDRTIEGKLLLGLSKHGKENYVNALACIPRNMRLLYLHSYQSFIWNKIVSKRIKIFGLSVLEGDLVRTVRDGDNKLEDSKICTKYIKVLDKSDVNSFSIYDVVYPLPGHSVIYPKNVIQDWYEEILSEDGLTFNSFKQADPQYSLCGAYRHILENVKDLLHSITYYSSVDDDLIISDLDKLNGKSVVEIRQEGEYKALILEFKLNTCCYATMVLREILKVDTSSMYQKTLNSYTLKRFNESGVNDDEDLPKRIKQ